LPEHEVTIRGRTEPMIVRTVNAAKNLSALAGDKNVEIVATHSAAMPLCDLSHT
jgi:hypothetical protein